MTFIVSQVVTVTLLVATSDAAPAASPEARFAAAQAQFEAAMAVSQQGGDTVEAKRGFYDAARAFAALAHDGVRSANLCMNAGNAYHFAGDDPRALLWYLRAQKLANIAETRNGVLVLRRAGGAALWPQDRGSIGRALMSWHFDVSRRAKQWILLAVYPLGCLAAVVAMFVRRRRAWGRLAIVLLLVGATMGISDVITAIRPPEPWAVVLSRAKGYAGDGEGYSVIVEAIPAGQEVRVVESRPDWVRVRLPSGTSCWLYREMCETL
ncbi:MAG: hypothetical protein JXA69_15365 [Phycisphaerae bacterium]|nr:hypothetical protein [Phycisphaerae bacterium]